MADLKGGTTGQILSKATNTDMDFTWITNDVGDITNIAVTSPITGGGSSGSVTIGVSAASTAAAGVVQLSDSTSTTSSVLASTPTATKSAYDLAAAAVPKSTVTTAGDVIYATGSSTVTRLGIGTAGQVLAVNSGVTAPEWITPSSGGITLISTTTLSGNATITLSSIPQTYTNLLLVYTGAYSAGTFDNLQFRMNTDSGSNYDWGFNGSAGSGGDFANAVSSTSIPLGSSTTSTTAADKASGIINIYNYAQTTTPIVTAAVTRTNYGGTPKSGCQAGQYRQAAAITSFSIIAGSTFSGGTIKLYGVK